MTDEIAAVRLHFLNFLCIFLTQIFLQAQQKLLDFDQKLDISLLDSVVLCMNSQTGERQKQAQVRTYR